MPRERIALGYDVVDNDYFTRGADAIRTDPTARQRLGLPENYFLASARFVPKKNLLGLVDAFALYRKRGGNWNLVIVGDGLLRPELESRVDHFGIHEFVHLAGFRQYDELPAYYGLASAFVLPSTIEQWGLVVNEAMAAGLPVIVSDVCGCAPDLVVDGETGFVVPPIADSIAEALVKLAGDPDRALEMGRRGRERIGAWGLDRFAGGLWHAARTSEPQRGSWCLSAILSAQLRK